MTSLKEEVTEIREDVGRLKLNTKWGFIIVGILLGSPRLGGPSAPDVVTFLLAPLLP